VKKRRDGRRKGRNKICPWMHNDNLSAGRRKDGACPAVTHKKSGRRATKELATSPHIRKGSQLLAEIRRKTGGTDISVKKEEGTPTARFMKGPTWWTVTRAIKQTEVIGGRALRVKKTS